MQSLLASYDVSSTLHPYLSISSHSLNPYLLCVILSLHLHATLPVPSVSPSLATYASSPSQTLSTSSLDPLPLKRSRLLLSLNPLPLKRSRFSLSQTLSIGISPTDSWGLFLHGPSSQFLQSSYKNPTAIASDFRVVQRTRFELAMAMAIITSADIAMLRALEDAQQAMAGCFASWKQMWTSHEDNMQGKRVRIGERVLLLGESVGEGASAYVRTATEEAPRPSMRKLALKRVLLQSEEQLEDVQLEIQAWETFARAPHVLRLIDWDIRPVKTGTNATTKEALMLFPLYEDGSLQELGGGREPIEAMQTFLQVAKALENLHHHEPPHAHRDVKPANVLVRLSHEGGTKNIEKVVLTDLGSCRPARIYVRSRRDALYLMEDAAQRCTAPYRAPELFDVASHCDVDERIDVWSMGCLLYFMMHGRSPFEPRADELGASVAMAVLSAKVEFPDEKSDGTPAAVGRAASPQEMKDLVRFCLNVDPADRPHIQQVIQRAEQVLESLQKEEGS